MCVVVHSRTLRMKPWRMAFCDCSTYEAFVVVLAGVLPFNEPEDAIFMGWASPCSRSAKSAIGEAGVVKCDFLSGYRYRYETSSSSLARHRKSVLLLFEGPRGGVGSFLGQGLAGWGDWVGWD